MLYLPSIVPVSWSLKVCILFFSIFLISRQCNETVCYGCNLLNAGCIISFCFSTEIYSCSFHWFNFFSLLLLFPNSKTYNYEHESIWFCSATGNTKYRNFNSLFLTCVSNLQISDKKINRSSSDCWKFSQFGLAISQHRRRKMLTVFHLQGIGNECMDR